MIGTAWQPHGASSRLRTVPRSSSTVPRERVLYAKIFSSLWDGTLARQWEGWSVFVYMLANCGPDGVLDQTHEVIAARTGMPLEAVEKGIGILEAADPDSRSPLEDGGRIVRLDDHRKWGWQIVNHQYYRSLIDGQTVREQNRLRQALRRSRLQPVAAQEASRNVTLRHAPSRQAEAEAEAEADKIEPSPSPNGSGGIEEEVDSKGWKTAFEDDFWPNYPKKPEKAKALTEWMKLVPKSDDKFTDIMSGLRAWNRFWSSQSTRYHFVPSPPYAHKWIKTHRWEAEPS